MHVSRLTHGLQIIFVSDKTPAPKAPYCPQPVDTLLKDIFILMTTYLDCRSHVNMLRVCRKWHAWGADTKLEQKVKGFFKGQFHARILTFPKGTTWEGHEKAKKFMDDPKTDFTKFRIPPVCEASYCYENITAFAEISIMDPSYLCIGLQSLILTSSDLGICSLCENWNTMKIEPSSDLLQGLHDCYLPRFEYNIRHVLNIKGSFQFSLRPYCKYPLPVFSMILEVIFKMKEIDAVRFDMPISGVTKLDQLLCLNHLLLKASHIKRLAFANIPLLNSPDWSEGLAFIKFGLIRMPKLRELQFFGLRTPINRENAAIIGNIITDRTKIRQNHKIKRLHFEDDYNKYKQEKAISIGEPGMYALLESLNDYPFSLTITFKVFSDIDHIKAKNRKIKIHYQKLPPPSQLCIETNPFC